MELTKRKKKILELIVNEYIKTAQPVSSEFLKDEYRLDISPPTIRIEMGDLTRRGYICQPHTSAGRIPTDKGYKFVVNEFLNERKNEIHSIFYQKIKERYQKNKNIGLDKFLKEISKILSEFSSALSLIYFSKNNLFFEDGLERVFREPEFHNWEFSYNFIKTAKYIEEKIENFFDQFFEKEKNQPNVLIGEKKIFPHSKDLAILISPILIKNKKTVVLLIGPKRMDYFKNIKLLNSFIDFFSKKYV